MVSTHILPFDYGNSFVFKYVLWDSYGSPDYRNVWMTFVKGKDFGLKEIKEFDSGDE